MKFGERISALCFQGLQPALQLLDFLFTLVPGLFENSIETGKSLALQTELQNRPTRSFNAHSPSFRWVWRSHPELVPVLCRLTEGRCGT